MPENMLINKRKLYPIHAIAVHVPTRESAEISIYCSNTTEDAIQQVIVELLGKDWYCASWQVKESSYV
jgi:formylmethanofuran dehydrogenase subunit E